MPQIPIRIPGDDRLLFTLCVQCAKKFKVNNTKKFEDYNCPHSEKERAFTATLTHLELKEALIQGYKVTHVYRAWQYNEWSTTLFRQYVQLLMKLKVESSDFPAGVDTEEDKQSFSKEYKQNLEIDIDIAKVRLNAGLRYISKILLNSLWGKFSQRNSLTKTLVISNPSEFFELVFDDRKEISQIIPVSEQTVRVTYRDKGDFIKENETSNIVVSLFTTR